MATLRAGRAAGERLAGLIDPAAPPLDPAVRDLFAALYPNAYAAGLPDCLVRLQPGGDPLFAARLIQRVPSVAVEPVRPAGVLERALAEYWLRRSDAVVDRDGLWAAVARVRRPAGRPAGLAVFTAAPESALAMALRERGARVFGAELVALLSPRFGRSLFLLEGRPAEVGLLALLRRYGGDVVLAGTCLLGAYAPARASALAAAELGRPIPAGELAQWRDGVARPAALLLGEVAASARTLHVPSAWVAAELLARHGREAAVLPVAAAARPGGSGSIRAMAAGLKAEACVWALELLRSWGVPARMTLDCPAGQRAGLAGLAGRLGVADRLGFGAGDGAVAAVLAMRGDGTPTAELVAALGRRCVTTRCLAESVDAPPWLTVLPDQASPPLLAAALDAALAADAPEASAASAWLARHDPAAVAAHLA